MSTLRNFAFILLFTLLLFHPAHANDSQSAMDEGTNLFARGQYEMAITQYRIALSWPGEHTARAHYNIGVCHYQLGRTRAAVNEYRAALQTREKYLQAAFALGLALKDLGEFTEAKIAFTQAVTISKQRDAEALFQLALLLAREGDYDTATQRLRQASKQAGKKFSGGHNNLGVIFALRGQYDAALREFEVALKQSNGTSREAQENLKLCRTLINSSATGLLARLQTVNQSQ